MLTDEDEYVTDLKRERDFYLRQIEEIRVLAERAIKRSFSYNTVNVAKVSALDIYRIITGDGVT